MADPIDQCYLYFGLRGRSMGPNYKQLKDKEHTFSLTTRYLIGAARSSLKISLMLNVMLFFMRPGSGSCHSWKKEIRTGPKATREKVGWYWYIYILCIVTYQTSNRWESANIAQTCADRTPYPSNSITCSSCTAMVFKKWCAYIGGSSGTWGGLPPLRFRTLVRLSSLELAGVVGVWIGSNEVGILSVRFTRVVGIGQGKIVDCRGCLAVRMLASVGYGVGK